MSQLNLFPEIFIRDRHAFCTSLDVATHFRKLHKNVLRDIELLKADCPEEFNGLNFEPVTYRDSKGEQRPMFYLSRDGFTLLAMGFTGKEALRWKLLYIAEFNRMEARIAELERKEAKDDGRIEAACGLVGSERAGLARQAMQLIAEGCRFTEAARLLGVSRHVVYRLRRRFGFLGMEV